MFTVTILGISFGLFAAGFGVVMMLLSAYELIRMTPEFASETGVTAVSITAWFVPLLIWSVAGIYLAARVFRTSSLPIGSTVVIMLTPFVSPLVNEFLDFSREVGFVPLGPILDVLGILSLFPFALGLVLIFHSLAPKATP